MSEYPKNFDKDTSEFTYPYFNTDDFSWMYSYTTLLDLQEYANLNKNNVFLGETNYFQNISANNVNGLDKSIYQYLVNITQDVQTSLNNIVDIFYNSTTKTTLINNNLIANNTGSMVSLSSTNASISNLINTKQINSSVINTNNINSQSINTNSLNCNNLQFNNDIGIYLFVPILIPNYGNSTTSSLLFIPLIKSQFTSNLFTTSASTYLLFHIKPNYRIDILNSLNYVIYSFTNTTTDIIYNKNLTVQNLYKINLYLNNILL